MTRDPRYDILFEPVEIGPVTAKNRFYRVPRCNGGGYRDPSAAAAMRRTKSEGGWGVVFTEQCELHHTSEITPFIELRLWDDADIPMLAKMAEAGTELGGRVARESALPGLAAWGRVKDYREYQLSQMPMSISISTAGFQPRRSSTSASRRWRWPPARPGGATG
jgi:2,4-dienoyl-CoA reductase-like NADH-dependent reductase (Old Yellow Enzyme family)